MASRTIPNEYIEGWIYSNIIKKYENDLHENECRMLVNNIWHRLTARWPQINHTTTIEALPLLALQYQAVEGQYMLIPASCRDLAFGVEFIDFYKRMPLSYVEEMPVLAITYDRNKDCLLVCEYGKVIDNNSMRRAIVEAWERI